MSSPNCGVDMSQEQLQCMLHTILHSADNNERRSIEKTVVRSLGTPATLTMLLSIVQNVQGSSSGVRQLAAVLLRKKVLSLWRAIPQESRGILKGSLLQQLGCEPVKAVRLALAHLVARLARADAQEDEGDGWPELIHAIHAAASDPRMEMREMAMIVACSVAEVTTQPRAQSDLVVEAVLQGMLDMEDSVQRPAVKAAEALLVFLREQKRQWENLVQRLVPQCVALF
ncbi:unnamed protein product [Trypanosoma congolense IL3000]|uniref:WGS project CAEQ00000000 data, annotated contig 1593 n=1 Tax=Trypanosoma congolense (strain IL3000) TaxID=1068625 RepID=F9W7D7_TRYCI|nr:unnamed protein product [Trypanosoma congolense IL3000]